MHSARPPGMPLSSVNVFSFRASQAAQTKPVPSQIVPFSDECRKSIFIAQAPVWFRFEKHLKLLFVEDFELKAVRQTFVHRVCAKPAIFELANERFQPPFSGVSQ